MTDRAREAWIAGLIGRSPNRPELRVQALTHGSASPRNYERLEFLGDRVLGLVIGEWLLEVYPTQPEGELSTRLNQIVSGEACAAIARDAGIQPHMILGKQARELADRPRLPSSMPVCTFPSRATTGSSTRRPMSAGFGCE